MPRRSGNNSVARLPFLAVVLLALFALLAGACTDDSVADVHKDDGSKLDLATIGPLSSNAEKADFNVRGSIEQVSVTGADHKAVLALYKGNKAVAVKKTDTQGSALFRLVEPGEYKVATVGKSQKASPKVQVRSVEGSTPDQSFYDDQHLVKGFQYITTRDGTTLSANVTLPGPIENGPYPTVVEYSGYSPSKPAHNLLKDRWDDIKGSLGGVTLEAACQVAPFACAAPDQPASLIASALGYAVVSVNMRGTGCSGGAYDFFEPLQLLDGYDIIETVAAQGWVRNHKVGMVGLSYPGIAQLFVASVNPPSLAAITPLSVYDDTVRGVLAPGGIFNSGFAFTWAHEVLDSAEPYGQGWEQAVVDSGDKVCEANQLLRGQNVNAVAKAKEYSYYEPQVADPLNPSLFVSKINVPVFLTGAFEDEQTGGRFPLLFNSFTNAPVKRFSVWNGVHADGFQPANIVEWKTFLDFYVAGELTPRPPAADIFLPLVSQEVFGKEMSMPPQRMFDDEPTFAEKKAAYEAEDPIRIRLESGAGDPDAIGTPVATLDFRTSSWPLPGVTPYALYFQPNGTLATTKAPDDGEASRFKVTPSLAELRTFNGDNDNDIFKADVKYDWKQEPDGAATVFVSEPLKEDHVFIGSASADLWVKSDAGDADLGVTLSEVRPDGKEVYIQSGVLRASERKLAKGSTELLPLHSNLERDAAPLPKDDYVQARVEIFPFGQIVRAGSRIRISVHTPGGDRPRWNYIINEVPNGSVVDIAHDAEHPSRVVLPDVPGISGYPATLPPCPGLRGQPCRSFEEYKNSPAGD